MIPEREGDEMDIEAKEAQGGGFCRSGRRKKGPSPLSQRFRPWQCIESRARQKYTPPVAADRLNFGMTVHGLFIGFS